MKFIICLFFLFSSVCIADRWDEVDLFHKQIHNLLDHKKYEEAAQQFSNRSNNDISIGYRVLSVFIQLERNDKNKYMLAIKYANKGCKAGDYHSCRERGKILVKQKEYKKAEVVFIETAKKYSDPISASELESLYFNKDWDGYNKKNALYWRTKIFEFSKKQSNKSSNLTFLYAAPLRSALYKKAG